MRQTPLYDLHKSLGARMVPFADWDMPVQYSGILEETRAVRTAVGLFDISHMGRVHVKGPGAAQLLQYVTTNDIDSLGAGAAHYSLIPNEQGGIIDDIIVYRLKPDEFSVILNASNTAVDLEWIRRHARGDVQIDEYTEQTAMIAVQGPAAEAALQQLTDDDLAAIGRFKFANGSIAGVPAALCRTGYTGEDGFELVVPAESAAMVWQSLMEKGAMACGLGARDVLRIEAGYPLYGHEIDETTSPVEALLMQLAVRLNKGDFIGREAIAKTKESGAARKLVGLTVDGKIAPRHGYTLLAGDEEIGVVTSGVYSPTVGHCVGMAYVQDAFSKPGTSVEIAVRQSRIPATVVSKKSLRDT